MGTPVRSRRFAFVLVFAISGAAALALVGVALNTSTVFFYGPADIAAHKAPAGKAIRIGGLVKPGSMVRRGQTLRFAVSDGSHDIAVTFDGPTPALFAEGQGTVASGRLDETGLFHADQVLAKHDERYMPPEVVRDLKASGRWGEGSGDPSQK